MKFIITLLMLIPFLTLSQLRVILGKDTIHLKDVSQIQGVIDSINTAQFKIYEKERNRIQDSIESAEIEKLKKAPTLYFKDTARDDNNKIYYYIDYQKITDDTIPSNLKKYKYDSLKTFNYLNYKVLREINNYREEKIEIDSLIQEEFVENNLTENVYMNNRGLLVKNEYNDCECNECFINYLKSKRIWKKLISKRTKFINLSITRDRNYAYVTIKYYRNFYYIEKIMILEI